jgi:N6-L-threonylcarbamoyladenine synthase
VNHIEGHLLAPLLDHGRGDEVFPCLALVVSGGHTELIEMRGVGDYRLVARTSDDAAGEAFDKSANLLGLDYPGGAGLSKLADSVPSSPFRLPKVMRDAPGFSFSGLKTAIALLIRDERARGGDRFPLPELAHTIQAAIVDELVTKLSLAVKSTGIRRVLLTGGVSANRMLRDKISSLSGVESFMPLPLHCMDNAGMIAYAAAWRLAGGDRGGLTIEVVSRWPVETMKPPGWNESGAAAEKGGRT